MTTPPHPSTPRDPPSYAPTGAGTGAAASSGPRPGTVRPSRPAERARLSLDLRPVHQATDGVWWPRSADLEREVIPLVAALAEARVGRVQRVLYDANAWLPAPRRRLPSDGEIEMKPSPVTGSRQVIVMIDGRDGIVLSVVPATTLKAPAERALQRAPAPSSEHGSGSRRTPVRRPVIDIRARPWFGTGGPAAVPPACG